jgi:hypothetical protein
VPTGCDTSVTVTGPGGTDLGGTNLATLMSQPLVSEACDPSTQVSVRYLYGPTGQNGWTVDSSPACARGARSGYSRRS